ncbi:sensor histidine kinase [Flavobacterium ardleyense]|uniref:sensor histidine kinase n=1 Tax=Flavobacterium ardleyense TaxID=2038737 RepID=UPI00298C2180|nr:hypothetical protein [Flavobacterium ardleyense]
MEIWKNPQVVIFWVFAIVLFIIFLIAAFYTLYMKSLAKSHQLEIDKKNIELETQFDLSQSVIKSQEAERERIARDMHDGFIGELVRMQYKIGMEQSVTALDIKELVVKSRNIIHDLSPPMINESSIDLLIEEEIKRYADSFGYQFYSNTQDQMVAMNSDTKINILRIFQELLQNTFKYANASVVKVSIYQRKDVLFLNYQDFGEVGKTENSDNELGGNGHKNIKFRNQYLKSIYKFRWIKSGGLKYCMLLKIEDEKNN